VRPGQVVALLLGAKPGAARGGEVAAGRRAQLGFALQERREGKFPVDLGPGPRHSRVLVVEIAGGGFAVLGRVVLVQGVRDLGAAVARNLGSPYQGVRHCDQQDNDAGGEDAGTGDAGLQFKQQQHVDGESWKGSAEHLEEPEGLKRCIWPAKFRPEEPS